MTCRSLEIVGERWTLLILRDAIFAGVTRYGDFQHNLGISTNILKTRLATLVEAGLMTRIDYLHADCGEPVHVETRCEEHGDVPADQVVVRPGPGMPADYLAARRPIRDR